MDARRLGALGAMAVVPYVMAGCASTAPAGAAPVPEVLRAPAAQTLVTEAHASGVQVYECKAAKEDAVRYEWTLRAPEANLLAPKGRVIGKHYAGPTWESEDGSKVVGTVVARDGGPDAAAIPWLLLRATSTTGPGIFADVKSIQRVHTVGGKAPADGCTAADAGKALRVAYSADYRFYR
jgi:hypothetical protein